MAPKLDINLGYWGIGPKGQGRGYARMQQMR